MLDHWRRAMPAHQRFNACQSFLRPKRNESRRWKVNGLEGPAMDHGPRLLLVYRSPCLSLRQSGWSCSMAPVDDRSFLFSCYFLRGLIRL